jgi:hypothetical protein
MIQNSFGSWNLVHNYQIYDELHQVKLLKETELDNQRACLGVKTILKMGFD